MNVSPLTLDMMKAIRTTLVLALLLMVTTAQAQRGSWKGELDVQGIKLPLVFHFTDKGCTMDSPAQNVREIPTQTVVKGDSVTVEIAMIGARFEGVNKGTEIEGTFTQQGMAFPLTLTPGEVTLNRPQTPKPPFDYLTEEVSFTNGSFTLRGTLTKPRGCSRQTPVVLMVSGSGQQNRDEELMGHKPFLVIADYLARHGIATLRYDDRGVGKSTGNMAMITLQSNMLDAEAGIDYLKSTKKFGKIGVLGHSEGGIISYMLAARGKADFVVSLAGPVLPGDSVLLMQNRDVLTTAGLDKDNVEKYATALSRVFKYRMSEQKMKFSNKPESLVPMLTMDINLMPELRKNLIETVKMVDSPWLVSYLKYDPATDIRKINSPVMLIIGDNDKQVNATANIQAAENILPKAVKAKSLLKAYPTLNHLFQPSETGSPGEYAKIETTISEEVLDDITSWITKTAKQY